MCSNGYALIVKSYGVTVASSRVFPTLTEARRAQRAEYGDRLKWKVVRVSVVDEAEDV